MLPTWAISDKDYAGTGCEKSFKLLANPILKYFSMGLVTILSLRRFTYERRCLASPTILRREGEDSNSILENGSEMVMNLTDIGVDEDMT